MTIISLNSVFGQIFAIELLPVYISIIDLHFYDAFAKNGKAFSTLSSTPSSAQQGYQELHKRT